MKIGIFPGSFNPVHIGHLALANYMAEFEGYDEIWFLITPKNPMKSKKNILDQDLRLKLIEESIKGYPKFKTCTIEWNMPYPTYTINTLQKLRIMYPQHNFELLIGGDNWLMLHRWKDYQMILKNFKTVVYPRMGDDKLKISEKNPHARYCKDAPRIDISSSMIREAIKKGNDVRFYMPTGTFEQVVQTGFFVPDVIEDTLNESEEQGESTI